jgi:hypothetical protein
LKPLAFCSAANTPTSSRNVPLIALERDDVIGLLVDDFPGDAALTPHRVYGDDGAFDRHHVEQGRNGDNLIGFFRYRDLPHDETLARGE